MFTLRSRDLALIGAGALALGAAACYYLFQQQQQTQQGQKKKIVVTQLHSYPVKSLSGTSTDQVALCETGIRFDREWAVVVVATSSAPPAAANTTTTTNNNNTSDVSAKIITQREYSKMRTVSARVVFGSDDDDGGGDNKPVSLVFKSTSAEFRLDLTENNKSTSAEFRLDLTENNKKEHTAAATPTIYSVELWGIQGKMIDEGDDVAKFLSEAIGVENCRLARIHPDRSAHRFPASSIWHSTITDSNDIVSAHDFSPLHLITEEGLEWVRRQKKNEKKKEEEEEEGKNEAIDALRFRPNVVVGGAAFPQEDSWKKFEIGGVKLRTAKHCGRCSIPTIFADGGKDKSYFPTGEMRKTRNAFYVHQLSEAQQKEWSAEIKEKMQRWPMFGLNVMFNGKAEAEKRTLRVGDEVVVTEAAEKQPLDFA